MTLTLVATANGRTSVPAAPGSDAQVLQVADGDVVTLTATSDGHAELGEVSWSVDGNRFTGSTPVETDDPRSKAIEISIAGAESRGAYVAASGSRNSNSVSLAGADADGHDDEDEHGRVVEVEVGETNRPFAYISLVVLAAFAGAIIFIAWRVVSRIALPGSGVVSRDENLFGTWAERSASIVDIIALAGGLVTILVGAWLAAIETRGRLRIRSSAGVDAKTGEPTPLDEQSVEVVGAILGKVRRFRGSIAVVVAGVCVVGFAVWGASSF